MAPAPVKVPPAKEWDDGPAGELAPGALAAAMRGRAGSLRACQGRSRPGKVVVELTFDEQGQVRSVRPVGEPGVDRAATRCLTRRLRALRVPPPSGGAARATHVFVFTGRAARR